MLKNKGRYQQKTLGKVYKPKRIKPVSEGVYEVSFILVDRKTKTALDTTMRIEVKKRNSLNSIQEALTEKLHKGNVHNKSIVVTSYTDIVFQHVNVLDEKYYFNI